MVQIPVPRDARNLMDRLLCDVDDRLGSNGVQELKVHQQTESTHACTLQCCRICKGDTDTAMTLVFLCSRLVIVRVMSVWHLALACLSVVFAYGETGKA